VLGQGFFAHEHKRIAVLVNISCHNAEQSVPEDVQVAELRILRHASVVQQNTVGADDKVPFLQLLDEKGTAQVVPLVSPFMSKQAPCPSLKSLAQSQANLL